MAFTKLKSVYKQRTGNDFEESDYESFGIVDEDGKLTNAGALLAMFVLGTPKRCAIYKEYMLVLFEKTNYNNMRRD